MQKGPATLSARRLAGWVETSRTTHPTFWTSHHHFSPFLKTLRKDDVRNLFAACQTRCRSQMHVRQAQNASFQTASRYFFGALGRRVSRRVATSWGLRCADEYLVANLGTFESAIFRTREVVASCLLLTWWRRLIWASQTEGCRFGAQTFLTVNSMVITKCAIKHVILTNVKHQY